ncbi:MAG: DMT family transporter [Clostridia bacterium]|nr:DMT family transporter [Clostridia bacterium]
MSKRKTIFSALLVMFLWGSLFPMIKIGYKAYNITSTGDILFFAGIRFTICSLIILLYSLIKNRVSFKAEKHKIHLIALSGLFAIILHYSFTYMGLNLTDSSKTAIIKQVGVCFYVCFSWLFFKDDKLTVKKLAGVLLGFSGIAAINMSSNGFTWHLGDSLILLASFCTVFSNVISKKLFNSVDPVTATGISQLFGGIVLLVIGVIMEGRISLKFNISVLIFVYICAASVLGYCIWFVIVKYNSLSKLFIIKFAEPVFASILAALLLGENIFSIQYLLAFLLIGGGIYISNT